jgi:hypothetical protein
MPMRVIAELDVRFLDVYAAEYLCLRIVDTLNTSYKCLFAGFHRTNDQSVIP